jgi:hypothetical protein
VRTTQTAASWLICQRFRVGVRVGSGGDIASAGEAPAGGWATMTRSGPTGVGVPAQLPTTAFGHIQGGEPAAPRRGRVTAPHVPSGDQPVVRGLGVSAKLVAVDGEVVAVGRWPAHEVR